uniref:Uncharacterized protein n=1 Tax=Oryza barthii TaxID=65489 RepID=A0A0D3HNT6_9ORYZ
MFILHLIDHGGGRQRCRTTTEEEIHLFTYIEHTRFTGPRRKGPTPTTERPTCASPAGGSQRVHRRACRLTLEDQSTRRRRLRQDRRRTGLDDLI